MTTKLEDHIDTPIKKCVVGLALIGFKPVFSCCGFTYSNEEVPKSHLPLKSYIFIDAALNYNQRAMLLHLAMESRWIIGQTAGFNEKSNFLDFYYTGWETGHPWAAADSPHRPEKNVIAIHFLEQVLGYFIQEISKTNPKAFESPIILTDGNKIYKEVIGLKHWQYQPCDDWEISLDTFNNL